LRNHRFLVETNGVSVWVEKPCRDLRCVQVDRLPDLAPVNHDGVEDRGPAVDQDRDQPAELGGGGPSAQPGATQLSGWVTKGGMAGAPLPQPPAEAVAIEEVGRAFDIGGEDLEVAAIPVGE
jgi:hypothetical protein